MGLPLSRLESHVLETIRENPDVNYTSLLGLSGLQEHVLFNLLQSLLIRGLIEINDMSEYKGR